MTAPLTTAPASPDRTRDRRPGRHLRPVDRTRTRRSPAVPVLVGAGIVIAALFALAAMHALLISNQIRLDEAHRQVASESEAIRHMRLRVAELESPDRVLEVARERLGMVAAEEVGYLLPAGVEGGPAEPVRVDPAAAPAPPPTTKSAEEAAVDAEVATEEAGGSSTDAAGHGDAAEGAPDAGDDAATDGGDDARADAGTRPIEGGPPDVTGGGAG